jgi:hypothetical protein
VVHLLIRRCQNDGVRFLLYPHGKWMTAARQPYLSLPTKKTVKDLLAEFNQGTALEMYVDDVLQNDLKLKVDGYAPEQEKGMTTAPILTLPVSGSSGGVTRGKGG